MLNRSLVEKARCLLFVAGLSKEVWAEAVATATYLRNRSAISERTKKTPYESWFGKNHQWPISESLAVQ